jgi:hypothetical protein
VTELTHPLHKIHIVGGPGSGKTTLARQVAARLRLPCYELDAVGYEGGAGAARPSAARLADVRQIAAQPAWVSEGIFLGWTADLFASASQIIWLDLPWRIAAWRILRRHVLAELRGSNPHSGWLKLYRFLQFSRGYYHPSAQAAADAGAENRITTQVYLASFQEKVLRCTNPGQVRAFFHSLPGR